MILMTNVDDSQTDLPAPAIARHRPKSQPPRTVSRARPPPRSAGLKAPQTNFGPKTKPCTASPARNATSEFRPPKKQNPARLCRAGSVGFAAWPAISARSPPEPRWASWGWSCAFWSSGTWAQRYLTPGGK